MAENQIECSRPEKRSVIKILVTEAFKPCKIYRIMCDIYGEACFGQEKSLQMGQTSLSQKESMKWKYTDSPVKKKF